MGWVFRPAYNSDLSISGKQHMPASTTLKATGKISVLSETSGIPGSRLISKITYLVLIGGEMDGRML